MLILNHEFLDQKSKISEYLSYLEHLENDSSDLTRFDSIVITTTQKSSFILILYNLVESMVTKLLTKIHNIALNGSVSYYDLNDNLRKTVFVYYDKILSDFNVDKQHLNIEKFYLMMNRNYKPIITYESMSEVYSLFSGNLDAREIRNVFKNKYGFNFKESEFKEGVLKRIREGRNTLAHGDESFEEYGRTLTIQDIKDMRDKVFSFLDSLILVVENYLNKKLYTKYVYRLCGSNSVSINYMLRI